MAPVPGGEPDTGAGTKASFRRGLLNDSYLLDSDRRLSMPARP